MIDEDELRAKVRRLSETVWENRCSGEAVDEWLEVFGPADGDGHEARLQMLYLLSNFLYFGVREVRVLLGALFRDLYRTHPARTALRADGLEADLTGLRLA